jgi:predicted unusual protein kinase regulating ubiquinone biosynthesis (AarF/ABC1/UbiB family)
LEQEFKIYLDQELDFRREAQNNARIRKQFSHVRKRENRGKRSNAQLLKDPQFATPNVYDKFTTQRLLVMEFIDGSTQLFLCLVI